MRNVNLQNSPSDNWDTSWMLKGYTSPDNIKAIKEATQPNNQQQLRAFSD